MTITSFSTLYIMITYTATVYSLKHYRDDQTSELKSKEGPWGGWSEWVYCEPGYYAQGFKLKNENCGDCDDTSSNAFQLVCKNQQNDEEILKASNDGPWGNWERQDCAATAAIKGFRAKVEDSCGGNCDDTALNAVRVFCTDGDEREIHSNGNWGQYPDNISWCNKGSVVCGFRQKVEHCSDCDDTSLNAVQLACCNSQKQYSHGQGYWDPIYTGNDGVIFSHQLTIGMTDYSEKSFSQEQVNTLATSLSTSFEFQGFGASLSLEASVSQSVTTNSVVGSATTVTEQRTVSCDPNGGYTGLYQFVVSAQESGFNHDTSNFHIHTEDYWCSTEANQAPQCPPGYCDHNKNCQACLPSKEDVFQEF